MYISASRQRDTVIVWEQRTHTGGLKIRKFPAPYECYVEVKVIKALQAKLDADTDNEDPKLEQFLTHVYNALTETAKKHISMFEDRLFKLKFKDGGQWKAFLGSVPVEVRLWESDIPPELKVLSANYYKAANPRLNLTFYDIEVDYDPNRGFSSTMDPYAPINSIAFYHVWKKEYKVFAVPPRGWDGKFDYTLFKDVQHKYEIITVDTEAELLALSVEEIQQTDVLSGYNSSLFDDPYFAQRVQMILGDEWFNRLSFPGGKPPYFREVEIMFRMQKQVQFDGRICCDYLELFKKFTVEDRDSWNLESVSADHLGERFAKLDYEGTLNDLYNNNFSKFTRYNLRDTEILGELDKKYKFINSANTLIHQSTCHFRNIVGTVRTADLAITNYCWYELDRRVPDSRILAEQGQAAGAYVLVPQHGIKEWIVCFDINSLYPNTIRTIGISPETLVGQFAEFEAAWTAIYNQTTMPLSFKWEKTGVIETKPACEWREILLERKLSVSGYGTVFDQSREGIIPALLGRWYATRKEYQALAKQKQKEMEEIKAQIAELEASM